MGECGRNKKSRLRAGDGWISHTVPSAGIIRTRSNGRAIDQTPLSPAAPSSRMVLNKIGYPEEVCNSSV
jgi:hypothetical protein